MDYKIIPMHLDPLDYTLLIYLPHIHTAFVVELIFLHRLMLYMP